jgi:acyl dehydratase/NAD(P)-dependent dehydrogenase (short-subunit alcohol dehydrogenase family)
MKEASFDVELTDADRQQFARLSGDHNPLHVDPEYAAGSTYGRCVLHGAFSAGLVSRLAGMHLPGRSCVLLGMRLKFVAPVFTPTKVTVKGQLVAGDHRSGEVRATISETATGRLFVEASYQFGQHVAGGPKAHLLHDGARSAVASSEPRVLVTGAAGGLGRELCRYLGARALPLVRPGHAIDGALAVDDLAAVDRANLAAPLSAIVHCAWPAPLNEGLLADRVTSEVLAQHVTAPLSHCIALGRLLQKFGRPNARLVIVGSSYAMPGRHAWRNPLYSIAKSALPALVKAMAVELAETGHQVFGVNPEVIDGGMNRAVSAATLQAHADRTLSGNLPTPHDVAQQIVWLLDSPGNLLSGSMIDITGGTIP